MDQAAVQALVAAAIAAAIAPINTENQRLSDGLVHAQNAYNQLDAENTRLRAEIVTLQNAALRPQAAAAVALPHPFLVTIPAPAAGFQGPRVPDFAYDGTRGSPCREFLRKVELIARQNRGNFTDDDGSLITFAISRLTGVAMEWADPILEDMAAAQRARNDSQRWASFKLSICAAFTDPDEQGTAQREIRALVCAPGKVAEYFATFRAAAPRTQYQDEALSDIAYDALPHQTRFALVGKDHSTLTKLANLATELDAEFEKVRQARRTAPPAPVAGIRRNPAHVPVPAPVQRPAQVPARPQAAAAPRPAIAPRPPAPAPNNGPAPMQLDAATRRAQRLAAGVCLYCGQAGHFARECPNNRRLQAAAATEQTPTATVEEVQADQEDF